MQNLGAKWHPVSINIPLFTILKVIFHSLTVLVVEFFPFFYCLHKCLPGQLTWFAFSTGGKISVCVSIPALFPIFIRIFHSFHLFFSQIFHLTPWPKSKSGALYTFCCRMSIFSISPLNNSGEVIWLVQPLFTLNQYTKFEYLGQKTWYFLKIYLTKIMAMIVLLQVSFFFVSMAGLDRFSNVWFTAPFWDMLCWLMHYILCQERLCGSVTQWTVVNLSSDGLAGPGCQQLPRG